ncbi:MAG TPA: aldo/keto reductase [Rhizomicrobium sp.]|nr:aldo/keto reductase [Rhizomicrobium sp.]
MGRKHPAELVLGSVQLGLAYGAANRTGKPSHSQACRLVARAAECGITKFDTARAYGDAEERLGEALRTHKAVRTITKLSPLSELPSDAPRSAVRAAVDESVDTSLLALRRRQIDCLLLHRAQHMTAFGGAVWERLIERLEDGTVLTLGVSVQSPPEALLALACPDICHVQLPFNILDWRWREAGVIERIRARTHVTIHARSVFLQGVLAAGDPAIWPKIAEVDAVCMTAMLAALAKEFQRESVSDLCLAYVRGQDWIDGVVVGMETEEQLDSNLRLFVRHPLSPVDCSAIEARMPRLPERLLDPAQWPPRE